MQSKWKDLIGIVLLFILGTAVSLTYNHQTAFSGSRIKNPDAYLLDIREMNGTDLHTMDLKEGDSLQIRFETMKGSLYMEIKAPDRSVVYQGNGKETTAFTVNIPESGIYTIAVEARQAKGVIHIQLKEEKYNIITTDKAYYNNALLP